MTRVFLAAGVAALAIAVPATAGPHGGGKDRQAPAANHGGGGQRAQAAPRVQRGGGGGFAAPRMQRAPRMAAPQMQRAQRFAAIERPQHAQRAQRQAPQVRMQARAERQQVRGNRAQAQNRMAERQQIRANQAQAQNRMAQRQQVRANRAQAQNRMAQRQQVRANRVQAQNRMAQQQQVRANRVQAQNRMAQRQDIRANRAQAQNRMAERQQIRMQRFQQIQSQAAQRQQLRGGRMAQQVAVNTRMANGFGAGGCPPGLISKGCMPPGQALQQMRQLPIQDRIASLQSFGDRASRRSISRRGRASSRRSRRDAFLGDAADDRRDLRRRSARCRSRSRYLYPATPNYYYQYGDGYLYQVDRSSSLIDALIPLLAGGYHAGHYLPQSYMSSYVPDYYGLNSFYPASYGYGGYGGYGAMASATGTTTSVTATPMASSIRSIA